MPLKIDLLHFARTCHGFVAFCDKMDFKGLIMTLGMIFLENLITPADSTLKIQRVYKKQYPNSTFFKMVFFAFYKKKSSNTEFRVLKRNIRQNDSFALI